MVHFYGPERELSFQVGVGEDTAFRYATDEELRDYYECHPHSVRDGKPDELRELFADRDGELFGLIAERHRLGAAQDREGLKANLQAICETPVLTDAGVTMKVELLMRTTWPHETNLSLVQQRQLLWNIQSWLWHTQINRVPMQSRPLDLDKLADAFRMYREEGIDPDQPTPQGIGGAAWLAMFAEYQDRMKDEAAAVRANQNDTDAEHRATEIATEATQSVEHRIAEAEADGLLGLAVKLAVLWNNSIADTGDPNEGDALMVGSALDYLAKQTGIEPYVTYDRDCKPIRAGEIGGAS